MAAPLEPQSPEKPAVSGPAACVIQLDACGQSDLCHLPVRDVSALAKLGNASMVGQYALALAIAAPVFMLTNLQLRAVQATDAPMSTVRRLFHASFCLYPARHTGDRRHSRVVHYDLATKASSCSSPAPRRSRQSPTSSRHCRIRAPGQSCRALMLRGIASLVVFASHSGTRVTCCRCRCASNHMDGYRRSL